MNKYLVELVGTALLTFVVLFTGNYLAIGAALAIAVLVSSSIGNAGAFNPAVTIALVQHGAISKSDLMGYIISQIAGAFVALELYHIVKRM